MSSYGESEFKNKKQNKKTEGLGHRNMETYSQSVLSLAGLLVAILFCGTGGDQSIVAPNSLSLS